MTVREARTALTSETQSVPARRPSPREPVDLGLTPAPPPSEREAPQPFTRNVVAITASAAAAPSQSIKSPDALAQPVTIDAAA